MCPRIASSKLPSCVTTLLFFFNDTATTEIYTLSLHDALPISAPRRLFGWRSGNAHTPLTMGSGGDRKSTRLNSSHLVISYAVFCLKKKKIMTNNTAMSTSRTPLEDRARPQVVRYQAHYETSVH